MLFQENDVFAHSFRCPHLDFVETGGLMKSDLTVASRFDDASLCSEMNHHRPRNITMQHVGLAMNTLQMSITPKTTRVSINELIRICEGNSPTDFGECAMHKYTSSLS